VQAHALKFGVARKNIGVQMRALKFGVAQRNIAMQMSTLNLVLHGAD
jgi:hypothetical protein